MGLVPSQPTWYTSQVLRSRLRSPIQSPHCCGKLRQAPGVKMEAPLKWGSYLNALTCFISRSQRKMMTTAKRRRLTALRVSDTRKMSATWIPNTVISRVYTNQSNMFLVKGLRHLCESNTQCDLHFSGNGLGKSRSCKYVPEVF